MMAKRYTVVVDESWGSDDVIVKTHDFDDKQKAKDFLYSVCNEHNATDLLEHTVLVNGDEIFLQTQVLDPDYE